MTASRLAADVAAGVAGSAAELVVGAGASAGNSTRDSCTVARRFFARLAGLSFGTSG
ncbi:hypothetical protein FQZ97_1278030 [compost metagenome]